MIAYFLFAMFFFFCAGFMFYTDRDSSEKRAVWLNAALLGMAFVMSGAAVFFLVETVIHAH